jgi:hypothetical protein
MHVISFKQTILFKRGIWLSAAALIAFAVIPSVLDASLWRNPLPALIAPCILSAFCAYVFWKLPIHRLADLVIDCEDHLVAQRGGIREIIPFLNIAEAQVSSGMGIHWISVRLKVPCMLGTQIDFLPQASLWSNLSGIQRIANGLTERANQDARR